MRPLCLLVNLIVFVSFNQLSSQNLFDKMRLSVSVDNDFFNAFGGRSDKYYTSGLLFSATYKKHNSNKSLPEIFFLAFENDSLKDYTWNFAQTIYTPEDLTLSIPSTGDWPYSGAIILSYAIASVNEKRTSGLKTEMQLGILGPLSFAQQVQELTHKIIEVRQPNGWASQIRNTLILNYNVTYEPKIFSTASLEMRGNAELKLGTLNNETRGGINIRAGVFDSYFQIPTKKFQMYVEYKPTVAFVLSNAYLQGNFFEKETPPEYPPLEYKLSASEIKNLYLENQVSLTLSYKNFGISYAQTHRTEQSVATKPHMYGTVKLFWRI